MVSTVKKMHNNNRSLKLTIKTIFILVIFGLGITNNVNALDIRKLQEYISKNDNISKDYMLEEVHYKQIGDYFIIYKNGLSKDEIDEWYTNYSNTSTNTLIKNHIGSLFYEKAPGIFRDDEGKDCPSEFLKVITTPSSISIQLYNEDLGFTFERNSIVIKNSLSEDKTTTTFTYSQLVEILERFSKTSIKGNLSPIKMGYDTFVVAKSQDGSIKLIIFNSRVKKLNTSAMSISLLNDDLARSIFKIEKYVYYIPKDNEQTSLFLTILTKSTLREEGNAIFNPRLYDVSQFYRNTNPEELTSEKVIEYMERFINPTKYLK